MEVKNTTTAGIKDQKEDCPDEIMIGGSNQRQSLPYFISESHDSGTSDRESITKKPKSDNTFGSLRSESYLNEADHSPEKTYRPKNNAVDQPVYVSFQKRSCSRKSKTSFDSSIFDKN